MAKRARRSSVKAPRRARAMSLHLGLNAVNPGHYGGWTGDLVACEFDANDMLAIARLRGMRSVVLITRKATRARTLAALRDAARTLKSGDFFLLTYSGHGGQIPDITGEEDDKNDETWCLYDGEFLDDELYLELSRFAAGVRVLVLSDSCHSGTVTRAPIQRPGDDAQPGRPKLMPAAVAMRTYRDHQKFYDNLQRALAKQAARVSIPDPDSALANVAVSNRRIGIVKQFKPSVILISGCQDNQTSMDGDHNGAFTEQLLQVWNHDHYRGNYAKFHAAIKARMPRSQTPNLFTLGPAAAFVTQSPFTV